MSEDTENSSITEEPSLRDQLADALREHTQEAAEGPVENPAEQKPAYSAQNHAESGQLRDEKGKFAGKSKAESVATVATAAGDAASTNAAPPADEAPQSWSADAKALFATLPEGVRREIAKREADVTKGFTKLDEERAFGRQLRDVINPYLPQIQAEGGDPIRAVKDLLNTAYILRTATPEVKGRLLLQVAQQYGAQFPQFQQAGTNPQQQMHPAFESIQQRLDRLEMERQQEVLSRQQQEREQISGQIEAFASDPVNVHFPKVRALMGQLIGSGAAKDLKDAYEQAIWASPQVRPLLVAQQDKDREAKRVADLSAKAEAARRAGSSVAGGPKGGIPSGAVSERSLTEELTANVRAAFGRI
jgi:hypothetical protein